MEKTVNPLEQVNNYLQSLERRLRWGAVARGAAVLAVAALVATVALVLYTNAYAFSDSSLADRASVACPQSCLGGRVRTVLPILSLNRRRAAKRAETLVPEFDARLLTFAEKQSKDDPFLELLAADTMEVAHTTDPGRIVSRGLMFGSASAAAFASLGLIWLILAGPGSSAMARRCCGPVLRERECAQDFYDIARHSGGPERAQEIGSDGRAQLVGFDARSATLFAKFAGTSKWEPAPMMPQPSGVGFEFLFAGLPDSVEYYVESNGVRSKTYTLTALDLPGIKKLRVTYHYPKWAGLKDVVEDRAAISAQSRVRMRRSRSKRTSLSRNR